MKKLFFTLLLLAFCALNTVAQQELSAVEKQIKELYDREDYKAAFELAMKEAQKGNAYAQSMVGKMYYNGKSVTEDN